MKTPATHIQRPTPDAPILLATDAAAIGIRAGTVITIEGISRTFETDTHIPFSNPTVGRDYGIGFDSDGNLCAEIVDQNPLSGKFFAGFHFAPGGNAVGRDGGDSEPAINPYSIWDIGFRPSCPDPRGMTRVQCTDGKSIWVDIYFLGVNHAEHDTSRFGETIANGDTMGLLDYQTTVKIIEGHGKRLLTYDEFRAAAYGVTERSSADRNPKKTGLDAARTSRFGMMQATGNLWIWGTDGDPDDPRPSLFGGSWLHGSSAGSRYASLVYWPGNSGVFIGARGASDHLNPV
ncbi:MAG: hypothetical protein J0H18_03105 [Rhizobiales bacterium]|nr:hypothetical protein [Hyphomicrobiales bacterium]OJY06646.1 MAG: hypothetical protein BGP07_16510 [Rhizobiales bacterium 63-22]